MTAEEPAPPRDNPVEFCSFSRWLDEHTCEYHRRFMNIPMFFHTDELDEQWQALVQSSQENVNQLMETHHILHQNPHIDAQMRSHIDTQAEQEERITRLAKRMHQAADLQNQLAMDKAQSGQVDEAIVVLEKTALLLSNQHLPTLMNLATLYGHSGDAEKTIEHDREVLKRASSRASALLRCADALQAVGLPQASIAILENYTKEYDSPEVHSVLRRLKSHMECRA